MDTLTESAAATASTPAAASPAAALRKLYFLRFAFAAAWAALLLTTAGTLTTLTAVLLVAYPLFDVGCAVADLRSARPEGRPVRGLYVNAALSTLTAAGLAVAATSGIPAVLRVWGAWAITAGLVQGGRGGARARGGGAAGGGGRAGGSPHPPPP
ncbi:hypothetical protein ACFV3O_12190, partial [Streptomyces albidoflavus]